MFWRVPTTHVMPSISSGKILVRYPFADSWLYCRCSKVNKTSNYEEHQTTTLCYPPRRSYTLLAKAFCRHCLRQAHREQVARTLLADSWSASGSYIDTEGLWQACFFCYICGCSRHGQIDT
jgi:hypothetical protein